MFDHLLGPGLPALIVGLIVGFYWARVIKLTLKIRRLTGKAANFLPPETLGRVIRIVWYPTVVVWVFAPLAIALLPPAGVTLPASLRYVFWTPWIQLPAAAVAFVCLYLTMICWRRMGRDWRMGIDPNEKNNLIVVGPYAWVRHPIYALQQALALASAVAVPAPVMFAVAAIEVIFLQWESRREERHLTSVHGTVYSEYMRHVGRFVPKSFGAYVPTRAVPAPGTPGRG